MGSKLRDDFSEREKEKEKSMYKVFRGSNTWGSRLARRRTCWERYWARRKIRELWTPGEKPSINVNAWIWRTHLRTLLIFSYYPTATWWTVREQQTCTQETDIDRVRRTQYVCWLFVKCMNHTHLMSDGICAFPSNFKNWKKKKIVLFEKNLWLRLWVGHNFGWDTVLDGVV